ncbi:A24 family peptidase [Mechercharimyces sp. CAU 1602]|uniref:prepilin peptidase n=1 Tax=Mechercharimyces sp. CAU 1602 TaxID=2973933 RepID=UPI002162DAC9|nr:A24 family peptidase [Mechercharimyces sp. CAU 1602]MCS1352427.1 A24 family peptidase [Mechercharimyces sp. CAU 1602]
MRVVIRIVEHTIYLFLIAILIAATITDIRERIIYDRFILIGLAFTLLFRSFYRSEPWWEYIGTGVGVFLVLFTIAVITNENSIGGGDVKLFAVIGLGLGWELFLAVFFLSHLLAGLWLLGVKMIRWHEVNRKTTLPFAPFILIGMIAVYLVSVNYG